MEINLQTKFIQYIQRLYEFQYRQYVWSKQYKRSLFNNNEVLKHLESFLTENQIITTKTIAYQKMIHNPFLTDLDRILFENEFKKFTESHLEKIIT